MVSPYTFAELQTWATNECAAAQLPVSRREIQVLLMAASGLDKAGLIDRAEQVSPENSTQTFKSYLRRRLQREPVYRILGCREFHGLQLELNEATLEPRDDTETLVEAVVAELENRKSQMRFLDLGTGTGAIALALLSELPQATCVALDVEPKTLAAASKNAHTNGLAERFEAVCSDWFAEVTGSFDFIVSNPPYIASSEMTNLEEEVQKFDPPLALDGGEDGLDAYREILSGARDFLQEGGFVGLEIGFDQRQSVSDLAIQLGWKSVKCLQDLTGNDRALIVQ